MTNNEYTVELPESKEERAYNPELYTSAVTFAEENEEFKAVDLQRHLKCGFGTVTKILDALTENRIVTPTADTPRKYRKI